MKYLYLSLCLLAAGATLRLTGRLSHALESKRSRADTHTNNDLGDRKKRPDALQNSFPGPGIPALVNDVTSAGMPSDSETGTTANRSTAPSKNSSSRASIQRLPPVRHHAALHETMITPGNFEYLGAIRPPHIQQNETTFGYGGTCIAYRADGDPSGPDDGFPGSLFLSGHRNQQKVAEISIPAPAISRMKIGDDLPITEILQPFEDVTHGLLEQMTAGSSEHFQLGGLLVTNGRLHWTMYKYYNVSGVDYPSHGSCGLNLRGSDCEGPWHLGPMNSGRPEWHSYKHAGYIFQIPDNQAAQWFGGQRLISGLQISTGLQASSQGPAMFAYSLPEKGANARLSLDAVPLVWYPERQPLERHHPADSWTGGAWLSLGDKQAVIISGRKALGEFYYGEARPQDCTQDKGYHGPPYEVEFVFYSPASLIHAAHGNISPVGLAPWMRWDGESECGGLNQYMFDTCDKRVGGMAYDREHNFLYLTQIDAVRTSDNPVEPLPVVHVFRIVE